MSKGRKGNGNKKRREEIIKRREEIKKCNCDRKVKSVYIQLNPK